MSFVPRKFNPLIAVPIAFLIWVLAVSAHFGFVLGAEVTREWIIAGVVVSFGVVFLILMLHEAADALATLAAAPAKRAFARVRDVRPLGDFSTTSFGTERIDLAFLDERRAALGLGSRTDRPNRPR